MNIAEKILEALNKEVEGLKNLTNELSEEELMELDRINITLDSILSSHKSESRFIGFTREITIKPTILTPREKYNNGYIAIPPEHPLNGLFYEEFNLGDEEWTYSKKANEDILRNAVPVLGNLDDITEDWWIIGYDTAHSWDNAETKSQQYVAKKICEYIKLLDANEYEIYGRV